MSNEVAIMNEKKMVQLAEEFIKDNGEIVIPPNYDVKQAVKSFYLQCLNTKDKRDRKALEVCTPLSIKKCIMEIVSKGLNPDKKQCYPIVYGNELTLQVGSFGNVKQAIAVSNVVEINAVCIREGDKVDIKVLPNGRLEIKHEQKWQNLNNPITGAYATAVFKDGTTQSDIMTIKEIKTSWSKSASGGKVAQEFPAEMCKKTVKSRLAKHIINTSDDSHKMGTSDIEFAEDDYTENNDIEVEEVNPIYADNFDSEEVQEQQPNVEEIKEEEPTLEEIENPFEDNEKEEIVVENIEEEYFEIPYSEYKDNSNLYEKKPNSYSQSKKTIFVKKI